MHLVSSRRVVYHRGLTRTRLNYSASHDVCSECHQAAAGGAAGDAAPLQSDAAAQLVPCASEPGMASSEKWVAGELPVEVVFVLAVLLLQPVHLVAMSGIAMISSGLGVSRPIKTHTLWRRVR
jgi:hypothetical protein